MSEPSLDGLRIERGASAPRSAKPIGIGLLLLLAAGGGLWWWWTTRAVAVEVHTVVVQAESDNAGDHTVLNASGYVTARRAATVSSKVTGKVSEILIEEGMKISEGQVLARLDETNVQANLQLARAQAGSAQAARSETRVRLQEAEKDLQRQANLKQRNVNTEADYDHAHAAHAALLARLEQQDADVAVAERTVAIWQQQLDDTVIRAPFAGTVTSKNAQPGEMISPMSTGGFTRTGICTIVDMQSLEIEIDVNESYINRVETGQAVEATLDAYPDWKIACHVIAIIPTADRNKSTVRVRVGFDHLDPRILPEMSVKVAFRDTAGPRASGTVRRGTIVPHAAIRDEDGKSIVFVVHDARAERRAVTIDRTDGDRVFVATGLTPGERVVIDPPKILSDQSHVKEAAP